MLLTAPVRQGCGQERVRRESSSEPPRGIWGVEGCLTGLNRRGRPREDERFGVHGREIGAAEPTQGLSVVR